MDDDPLTRLRIKRLERSDTGWWLLFSWTPDTEVFEAGRDAIKYLPYDDRAWSPTEKAWWVREWGLRLLSEEAPALDKLLARIEDQARQELEQRERIPVTVADAFAALHLAVGAPLALIHATRRVLALQAHPDKGGSVASMRRINTAADRCEAWWAQRATMNR